MARTRRGVAPRALPAADFFDFGFFRATGIAAGI
jgi:hypothetical protein